MNLSIRARCRLTGLNWPIAALAAAMLFGLVDAPPHRPVHAFDPDDSAPTAEVAPSDGEARFPLPFTGEGATLPSSARLAAESSTGRMSEDLEFRPSDVGPDEPTHASPEPDQGIIGSEDDILTITTTKGPCGPSLTFSDGEVAYFRYKSTMAGPLSIYYGGPRGETFVTTIDLPAGTIYRYTPTIDAAGGGARMYVRLIQPSNHAQAYCTFTVESTVSSLCAWATSMFADCGTRVYETEFESCATGRHYWYAGEVASGHEDTHYDSITSTGTQDRRAALTISETPSLWSFESPRVAWDSECYSHVLTGYGSARLIGFAPTVSCSDCPSTRDHGGTINVWTQRGSFYNCDGVFRHGETLRVYVRAGQSGTTTLTVRHSDNTHTAFNLGWLSAGITYAGDFIVDDDPPGRQVMYVQQAEARAFDTCSYIVEAPGTIDLPRMCSTVGSLSVETIPAEPIVGEPFTILISGIALDGCVPGMLDARLRSGIIELDLAWGGCDRSCSGVPTSWEREVVMTIPYSDVFPTTVAMTCSGRVEVCDDGVISVREPKPVFVLLPGIAGSKIENKSDDPLRGGEAWPNIVDLLLYFRSPTLRSLYLTGLDTLRLQTDGERPANAEDVIVATEPFWEVPVGGKWFGDFYETLRRTIEDEDWGTLVPCPYDWRLAIDSREVISRVDACVAEALESAGAPAAFDSGARSSGAPMPVPASPVILLGHSMGGLVARSYVADEDRARLIDRVITVGTPYLGAPVSYGRYPVGVTGVKLIDLAGNDVNIAVHSVYQNSPGALYLLPSSDYGGSPLLHHNGSPVAHDSQLSVLQTLGLNRSLVGAARRLHGRLDDLGENAYVPTHVLASGATRTTPFAVSVTSRRQRSGRSVIIRRMAETLSKVHGDGTVPLVSAMANPSRDTVFRPGEAHVCVYSSETLASGKQHGELMSDSNVLADIRQLALGEDAEHCATIHGSAGAGTGTGSGAGALADANSEFHKVITARAGTGVAYELDIFGASTVLAEDTATGARIGVDEDGTPYADWPGAELHAVADGVYQLSLSDEVRTGTADVSFIGHSEQHREITIRRFSPESIDELTVHERFRFVDVPEEPEDGSYRLTIPVEVDAIPELLILNSGGRVLRTIEPSHVLKGDQAKDVESPTLTIDDLGPEGASLVVHAEDSGSGIDEVLFSLDGGTTWTEYSMLIALTPGFHGVVQAIATDRAGNSTWPPVSREVSRPAQPIFLPIALHGLACPSPAPPTDLAIVIDVSPAMHEPGDGGRTPLDGTVEALHGLVERLSLDDGRDRVAVLHYGLAAEAVLSLTSDRPAIDAAIDLAARQEAPGTQLAAALYDVASALPAEAGRSRVALLVYHGGDSPRLGESLLGAANVLRGAGIAVVIAGVGSEADAPILREATRSRRAYIGVNSADELVGRLERLDAAVRCPGGAGWP